VVFLLTYKYVGVKNKKQSRYRKIKKLITVRRPKNGIIGRLEVRSTNRIGQQYNRLGVYCILLISHFIKTIADLHCTHCLCFTNINNYQSYIKECNFKEA